MSPIDTHHLVSTGFVLSGNSLDVEAVTQALELDPTAASGPVETARMADGTPFIREAFWSLNFEKEATASTEPGLRRLLEILWPKRADILRQRELFELEVTFYSNVTIKEGYLGHPVCLLEPKTLERMSYFEPEYSVDVFDYREECGGSWLKSLEDVSYEESALPLISVRLSLENDRLEGRPGTEISPVGISGSREERADDLDEVMAAFLAQNPGSGLGEAPIGKGSRYLRASVLIHENRPLYRLSAETLKSLRGIGCGFILEIFDFAD